MPRIFVPGPSVNPSIGSPAEFIKQIANTANRFRTNQQRDDELENIKLFRQQTQDLNERKQDFTEAEPERARAEALFQREQSNQRAKEQSAAVGGAGGSRIDPFLKNPETQDFFKSQGITDPAEQRRMVEEIHAKDRSIFSNSKVAGQTAFDSIVAGGGSLAEAEAARAAAIRQIFPTPLSDDLAGKLIIKPDGGVSTSKLFGSGKGTSATAPLQGIPNQISSEELQKLLNDKLGVEGNRFSLFGFRPTDNEFLGGAHDLEESDVASLQGQFARDLRPETIQRVLLAVGDPKDGTVKFNPKDMSPKEKEDFLSLGKELEAKANEGRAQYGPLAGLSVADIQRLEQDRFRQIADFNTGIINQTSVQNKTYEDRLNALRKSLGQPNGAAAAELNNTRQGGDQGSTTQGAPTVAPTVAPDGETSGSPELDKLLTPAPTASAPQPASAQGPSLVGGDPTDKLFGGIADNVSSLVDYSPIVAGSRIASEGGSKLFNAIEQFLPQGQDISAFQRTPQAIPQTPVSPSVQELENTGLFPKEQEARIASIEKEIDAMPPPQERTLVQQARALKLLKELRDLQ